jgi:hypothetical protein
MERALPPATLREKLPRFLQKCAQEFQDDVRYRDDPRYLRVWIQLVSQPQSAATTRLDPLPLPLLLPTQCIIVALEQVAPIIYRAPFGFGGLVVRNHLTGFLHSVDGLCGGCEAIAQEDGEEWNWP